MRYYARLGALLTLVASGALVACTSDSNSANDTLPPIASTTTTTTLPPTTTTIPTSYTIQSGDSLGAIAAQFGLTTDYLAAYNGIVNKDDIQAGQTLKIPQPGETTTTVAAVIDPTSTTIAP